MAGAWEATFQRSCQMVLTPPSSNPSAAKVDGGLTVQLLSWDLLWNVPVHYNGCIMVASVRAGRDGR